MPDDTAHEPGRGPDHPAEGPAVRERGGGQADTEERLQLLESQVQTLAQAVRALAQGLEKIPTQDVPLDARAARGARLAHELLIAQRL